MRLGRLLSMGEIVEQAPVEDPPPVPEDDVPAEPVVANADR